MYYSLNLVGSFILIYLLAACGGSGSGTPAANATSVVNTAASTAAPTITATTAPDEDPPAAPVVLSNVSTSSASAPIQVSNQVVEATVAAINSAPALSDEQAQRSALALWRNSDLTKHPKGSCAGCHGADFFDLARIGSTDLDIVRRATTDGATQAEAQALLQTVKKMRTQLNMPPTNARSFRPFQPGGQLLAAPASDPPHIANIKRDIAFGKQLETYLPTLMSGRVDSLAKAQRARDELLDIAQGTNLAGANPKKVTLRNLPIGIEYPLWSADLHHGKSEGTFNDWVADIAHDPKPEFREQWLALQDAYLNNPSNENFWRMFNASKIMTQVPLLGSCAVAGSTTQNQCSATLEFNKTKFLSALMGQHMLRLQSTGKTLDDFYQGAVSLSYLDNDATFKAFMTDRENFPLLPNNPWEVADRGRVMLISNNNAGSFQANLRSLGYPEFAVQSIDPQRTVDQEKTALFKPWFWIGFTIDPSFARIHKSNATKVGEYMIANLMEERFFNHNMFAGLMRLAVAGTVQDANVVGKTRPTRVEPVAPVFLMNYSYLVGYDRTLLDTQWNDPNGNPIPAALKTELEGYWHRLTGNGFRMSLYLQIDEVEKNRLSADQTTQLLGWIGKTVNATNGTVKYGTLSAMHKHFNRYHKTSLADDVALLEKMKTVVGLTDAQW
jgi:hypothetical protein